MCKGSRIDILINITLLATDMSPLLTKSFAVWPAGPAEIGSGQFQVDHNHINKNCNESVNNN